MNIRVGYVDIVDIQDTKAFSNINFNHITESTSFLLTLILVVDLTYCASHHYNTLFI